MIRPLTMAETAAMVGLSYHYFRKTWRTLVRDGFPQPFRGRCWSAQAVEAWVERRTYRAAAKAPADPQRIVSQRAQLADMMRRRAA